MFDFINIFKAKEIIGLSVHFVSQNDYKLAYCVLTKAKEDIAISDFKSVESLDNLKEIALNKAIFINISGKTVLEKIENNTHLELLKVFPNSDLEKFYYQIIPQESSTLSALIRKEKLNLIIEKLQQIDLKPISVSLGCAISLNAFRSISELNLGEYNILEKQIVIENESIVSIRSTEEDLDNTFDIDNNLLNANEFLAFSASLNWVLSDNAIKVDGALEMEASDYYHKRIFDTLKLAIPLFFLVALMINFIFFSSLLTTNNTLNQGDLVNKKVLRQLNLLKNEVSKKETFLKESKWLSQSKVSFYADQIGVLLPNKISLKKIDLFPSTLIKKNGTKDYQFDSNVIFIEGFSTNLEDFNNWKTVLQNQNWVKDVELISYNQETKRKNISFEIKLSIH